MKKKLELKKLDNGGHLMISVQTAAGSHGPAKKTDPLLELQLAMATTSINHEYARMEYDDVECRERREELLHYMDECRTKYLAAREKLSIMAPASVDSFEKELSLQKRSTLHRYDA